MKTSPHAQAAKEIRSELKKTFPLTKFSVTSESGNSVRISWINGPTYDSVQQIGNKYQYGHFNGMEDIYETSNRNEDLSQVKFVICDREISFEVFDKLYQHVKATHEGYEHEWQRREYVFRTLSPQDLTTGVFTY